MLVNGELLLIPMTSRPYKLMPSRSIHLNHPFQVRDLQLVLLIRSIPAHSSLFILTSHILVLIMAIMFAAALYSSS